MDCSYNLSNEYFYFTFISLLLEDYGWIEFNTFLLKSVHLKFFNFLFVFIEQLQTRYNFL